MAGLLLSLALLAIGCAPIARAACPFGHGSGSNSEGSSKYTRNLVPGTPNFDIWAPAPKFVGATKGNETFFAPPLSRGDYDAIRADLKALMTDSQEFWPADYGHYGGFFIRFAWHCAGTYRESDGRGGCDGGRIRHLPEISWKDNTNLDKALRLLEPIKKKWMNTISWGDLIILSGNVAIEDMGGPVLGFCGGRGEEANGKESELLGPTARQHELMPCPVNGQCDFPIGPSVINLIYVDPEGPMGSHNPERAVADVRSAFQRMGFTDREAVALIGGGHAFGKVHGACPTGAGPTPLEQPEDPYPGTCGEGKLKGRGPNTFTSGLEGPWSPEPTKWTNNYFQNLLRYDWELTMSPGGGKVFKPKARPGDAPPPDIMMLTTDIAFLKDPVYLELVKEFARDQKALEDLFAKMWYKLTTSDMGPASRCTGPDVPPPQPDQNPLPPPPTGAWDRAAVVTALRELVRTTGAGKLATLAYNCAATYRATDYKGGCNGGRIQFADGELAWPSNSGLADVVDALRPISAAHPNVAFADLVVLAGTVAAEEALGVDTVARFCSGRSDAESSAYSVDLSPRLYYPTPELALDDNRRVRGLTVEDAVALAARPRNEALQQAVGYSGAYPNSDGAPANAYFKMLLAEEWDPVVPGAALRAGALKQGTCSEGGAAAEPGECGYDIVDDGKPNDIETEVPEGIKVDVDGRVIGEWQARGKEGVYITYADWALLQTEDYRSVVQRFAEDEQAFKQAFEAGWTKIMNADRFDGPTGSVCDKA